MQGKIFSGRGDLLCAMVWWTKFVETPRIAVYGNNGDAPSVARDRHSPTLIERVGLFELPAVNHGGQGDPLESRPGVENAFDHKSNVPASWSLRPKAPRIRNRPGGQSGANVRSSRFYRGGNSCSPVRRKCGETVMTLRKSIENQATSTSHSGFLLAASHLSP
jgi:hypothetical protein